MKLVVYNLRDFDEKEYFDHFCAQYGYEYVGTAEAPNPDNYELARGADAINIIPTPMQKEQIDAFHAMGVRYITTRAIGVDHIDVGYAHKLGMKVSNVTYSPESVANYAIMLMLIGCRKFMEIRERAQLQDYTLKGKMGKEISNCTVGVIGAGRIGETLIRHLSGFGCRILVYSRSERESVKQYAEYVSLEELYAQSDIITLHVPGHPALHHMIDAEAFAKMKDGVILINTARGSLVDTGALIANIENGKVGFAGMDTIEQEMGLYYQNHIGDVIANHDLAILRSFPNVVVSPHTAFYTDQAISDQIRCTIESLYAFEHGIPNPREIL